MKDDSPRPLTLYRFSSKFFNYHEFSTIEPFLQKITTRVNEGYDDIHAKYGYLDTVCPRIEDHRNFINEFHLLEDQSYLMILLKRQEAAPLSDMELSELIKAKDIPLVEVTGEEAFNYNNLQSSEIIGTLILKPCPSDPGHIEPTAFVSFFKGTGRFLLETVESLVLKEYSDITHTRVQVLVCHELVPFYSKFGFVEYLPRQTQIVKDGVVVEGCMTGVPAHKGYEIAWMNKQIRL